MCSGIHSRKGVRVGNCKTTTGKLETHRIQTNRFSSSSTVNYIILYRLYRVFVMFLGRNKSIIICGIDKFIRQHLKGNVDVCEYLQEFERNTFT